MSSQFNQSTEVQQFPEPCSIPGGWIEPNCHFFSNTPSAILYQSIAVSLQRHGVQIDANPMDFKIHCRHYEDSTSLSFCARIFSNDDGTGAAYVPLDHDTVSELSKLTSSFANLPAYSHDDVVAATETLKSIKYAVEFQFRTVSLCSIVSYDSHLIEFVLIHCN